MLCNEQTEGYLVSATAHVNKRHQLLYIYRCRLILNALYSASVIKRLHVFSMGKNLLFTPQHHTCLCDLLAAG